MSEHDEIRDSSGDAQNHVTKPSKSIVFVSDPEKIKILMDKVRLSILRVLREGIMDDGKIRHEMTVKEIAQRLGIKTPQKLYHHIDLLVEHGFVYPSREEKKKRSIITYYARTAPGFMVLHNVGESPEMKDEMSTLALTFLNAFGIPKEKIDFAKLVSLLELYHAEKAKAIKTYVPLLKEDLTSENVRFIMEIIAFLAVSYSKNGAQILSELQEIIIPQLNNLLKK